MFKMEDLKLGMKVLVFDLYNKTCDTSTIVGLTIDGDITIDTNGKTSKLHQWDYKRNDNWWYSGTVWCFPDSTKYIKHVQKKLRGETIPNRKKVFVDYDKYPHDNNKKQIERNLVKQRVFVNKVIEQGFVWYVTYDGHGNRVWEKEKNPKVDFRNNNYFLSTLSGFTCVKKEGKTLSLTNPEKD